MLCSPLARAHAHLRVERVREHELILVPEGRRNILYIVRRVRKEILRNVHLRRDNVLLRGAAHRRAKNVAKIASIFSPVFALQ